MAKAPLVNGRTARQLAVVLDNCTKRDCCNTCPYDKMHDRGKSCIDFMIADASLALRRLQKRYEKQRERYYLDREELTKQIMNRPLYVAYFSDPEFREIHMLGVFDTEDRAKEFLAERQENARKAKVYNLIFGVSKTTDRFTDGEE